MTILTVIFYDVKRTVGVPVVSFVGTGIEGTKDEGFPNSGNLRAEVEPRFHMPDFALIEDLQMTSISVKVQTKIKEDRVP